MGESKHDGLAVPGQVVLAHEPPFTIGSLSVDPSTRQVAAHGRHETLEPRVMQVLVALYRAASIVTRDELIQRCWDGRIVTDDAINRVLSRIRHVAEHIGGGSFKIETIARVGYRLVAESQTPAASPLSGSKPIERRRALIGTAAAAAAAAAGIAGWNLLRPSYEPKPAALALYEKGLEARNSGVLELGHQAHAYFSQAVELDPEFADAWGALALQTAWLIGEVDSDQLDATAQRARSAASRALELKPGQEEALDALVLIPSWFRNWRRSEQQVRGALSRHSERLFLPVRLGRIMSSVARWDEAIRSHSALARAQPLRPEPSSYLAFAYWGAGRLVEAEQESARAVGKWPKNPGPWFTHMALLTYSGQPAKAVAFGMDRDRQPITAERAAEKRVLAARALASRDKALISEASESMLAGVRAAIGFAAPATRYFAALGDVDRCFDLIEAYLLRRGSLARSAKPIHPLDRIDTDFLFYPPSRILWGDPRFDQVTRAIGLNAYWQSIGMTPPHFRA